jgi:hypothetical protein
MIKPITLAVLAALAASPVLADEFSDKLNAGKDDVNQQQQAASKTYKDQAKIDAALIAMNDGNEVAGPIAEYAKDHAVKIQLDAKLPDYPRVLSVFIAEKVTTLMLADMPDCAERQYMALSMGTRTWLELGGDAKKLPVIEPLNGWKDAILADQFHLWLDNGSEMALYKISQDSKTPDIMQLLDKEKDPAKRKTLEAANKRFTDFLLAESQWREGNSYRLK